MKRVNVITIENLLPEVFRDTKPNSEIWLSRITFNRGGRYLIHAESGTGKSSLCSYIYGNRDDYSGRILMDGEDTRSFSIARWCELRQRSISLLPQEMRLFPELSVLENIDIKNRLTSHKSPDEIMEMLSRLDIAEKADEKVARLSIGQQQRVAIVRALCQPFDFLLLDEPVSHLDERNNAIAAALIMEEAMRQEAAIIATSVGNDLKMDVTQRIRL
ncbi:MAG: ATP-binding cassette domain-containing protein [Lachnospiraceae bacterium]|nr:ATP-binding cassette domain-containing protein [Lachnospiraceae bacterium]